MVASFYHALGRGLPYTMVAAAFAGPGLVLAAALGIMHGRRGAARATTPRPTHDMLSTAGMLVLAVGITAMGLVALIGWTDTPSIVTVPTSGPDTEHMETHKERRDTGGAWLFYCAIVCILIHMAAPVWSRLTRRFRRATSPPTG